MPRWEQLPSNGDHAPLARSSHSINAVGSKLYVFGGEHKPREPVDNLLYCYDLEARAWAAPVPGTAAAPAPGARVGHTAAALGGKLYVYGGRTGVDTGVGTGTGETALGDLWEFDLAQGSWREVKAPGGPPRRSYHAMAASDTKLYVFGGCGEAGRLNDLWEFDPLAHEGAGAWRGLPSSPHIKGRGGAGLVASADGASLFVICGFCGHELSDAHRFDVASGGWDCPGCCEEDMAAALPARSVFGLGSHACGACAACSHANHVLLFGGEVDPSTQGHEGAGAFSNDVFCMDTAHGRGAASAWHKLQPEGQPPMPRGWFAAAAVPGGMVVYGGNSASNERLEDMWLLKVHDS